MLILLSIKLKFMFGGGSKWRKNDLVIVLIFGVLVLIQVS